MKIYRKTLEATILFTVYMMLIIPAGFEYGISGDPVVYAAQFNTGCTAGQEFIYCGILYIVNSLANTTVSPASVVFASFLQVFLAFYVLTASFSRALIGTVFFGASSIGFLVSFNLYRTSLAILVFAATIRLMKKHGWRLSMASFLAGFAHNVGFLLAVLSKTRALLMGVGILVFFYYFPIVSNFLIGKYDFYLGKVAVNFVGASIISLTAVTNIIGLYGLYRSGINKQDYTSWMFCILLVVASSLSLIAGINILFERIAAFYVFFLIYMIVACNLYRKSLTIMIFLMLNFLNLIRLIATDIF